MDVFIAGRKLILHRYKEEKQREAIRKAFVWEETYPQEDEKQQKIKAFKFIIVHAPVYRGCCYEEQSEISDTEGLFLFSSW